MVKYLENSVTWYMYYNSVRAPHLFLNASSTLLLSSVLFQLRMDRDSAVQASASAYQAGELLRDQLSLVTRERDIAQAKVHLICMCMFSDCMLLGGRASRRSNQGATRGTGHVSHAWQTELLQ